MTIIPRRDLTTIVDEAAETRRIQPIDGARFVERPAAACALYAELEYDELASEQIVLYEAEGLASSRDADTTRAEHRPASKELKRQLAAQQEVVAQQRQIYLDAVAALGPYRRREVGAKKWYLLRWGVLLLGDVAGQAGAALSYGEHPSTAFPQAFATGMAAVTAGIVGGELRDLRSAARRQRDSEDLPEALGRWQHLFRGSDTGRVLAYVMVAVGVCTTLAIAGGIYWLRAVVEGGEGGLVYSLLALAIGLGSAINAYFYADEVADQIDTAEAGYARELRRAAQLAGHKVRRQHSAARAESQSICAEHAARGSAASQHLTALKWRVMGANPGVAGHGPSSGPKPPAPRAGRVGGGRRA